MADKEPTPWYFDQYVYPSIPAKARPWLAKGEVQIGAPGSRGMEGDPLFYLRKIVKGKDGKLDLAWKSPDEINAEMKKNFNRDFDNSAEAVRDREIAAEIARENGEKPEPDGGAQAFARERFLKWNESRQAALAKLLGVSNLDEFRGRIKSLLDANNIAYDDRYVNIFADKAAERFINTDRFTKAWRKQYDDRYNKAKNVVENTELVDTGKKLDDAIDLSRKDWLKDNKTPMYTDEKDFQENVAMPMTRAWEMANAGRGNKNYHAFDSDIAFRRLQAQGAAKDFKDYGARNALKYYSLKDQDADFLNNVKRNTAEREMNNLSWTQDEEEKKRRAAVAQNNAKAWLRGPQPGVSWTDTGGGVMTDWRNKEVFDN